MAAKSMDQQEFRKPEQECADYGDRDDRNAMDFIEAAITCVLEES